MKPIKQRNNFECGPVAIRNAMVLKGLKPKSVKALRKLCKTDRDGTDYVSMANTLIKLKLIYGCTIGQCEYVLSWFTHGKGFILGYSAGTEGHYTVISYDGKNYLAHNWAPDKLIERGSHRDCKPTAVISKRWLVSKLKQPNAEIYLL